MAITIKIENMAILDINSDSGSTARTRKRLRIKDIPHPLLFSLCLLSKVRMNMTDIVLTTMREYAYGLRVVEENEDKRRYGHEHSLLDVLAKFYWFLYPYELPQYILKDT